MTDGCTIYGPANNRKTNVKRSYYITEVWRDTKLVAWILTNVTTHWIIVFTNNIVDHITPYKRSLSFPQAGPRSAVGRAPDSLSQGSWVRYTAWQHTFVSPSADLRGAVVSYWRKYVHGVLVNRLGGLLVGCLVVLG